MWARSFKHSKTTSNVLVTYSIYHQRAGKTNLFHMRGCQFHAFNTWCTFNLKYLWGKQEQVEQYKAMFVFYFAGSVDTNSNIAIVANDLVAELQDLAGSNLITFSVFEQWLQECVIGGAESDMCNKVLYKVRELTRWEAFQEKWMGQSALFKVSRAEKSQWLLWWDSKQKSFNRNHRD